MIASKIRIRPDRPHLSKAVTTALLLASLALCSNVSTTLTAQTAPAPAPLPFESDFESAEGYAPGALTADDWWHFDSGLDASIVIPGAASSQALNFTGGGALELFTDSGAAPISWVDFYLKPVFVDPAELPEVIAQPQSAVTGFVKVNAQGEVYAIDGDGLGGGAWLPSGQLRALQGGTAQDWVRLTYRLDYSRKTWDLFVDGAMVMTNLGFLDTTVAELTQFAAQADATADTLLDYFYAGNENPLYIDTANDGLPDAWLAAQGLDSSFNQRAGDADRDGLTNLFEYQIATSATTADSDGDGVHDGAEHLAGADPTLADPYDLSLLPFSESFEAYALGALGAQGKWITSGESVQVQSSEVAGGTYALELTGDSTASNFLDGSAQSVVWIDLYLKPTAEPLPPALPEDVALGYYFDPDGRPIVFDGSGASDGSGFWRLLDAAQSADWRRVTVKMDYAAQTYDFYLDGERLGAGFGFARAQPYLSRFTDKRLGARTMHFDLRCLNTLNQYNLG